MSCGARGAVPVLEQPASVVAVASRQTTSTALGVIPARVFKRLEFTRDDMNSPSAQKRRDSSGHGDPAASGNGSCLGEDNQGVITTMTRPVGQSFSLLSFYFNLLGTGNATQNSITVTGSNGASQTFSLGNLYNNVFTELPEDSTTTEKILKGNGYEAFFDTSPFDIFKNVTSIVWTAFPTANVRLDDIQVSYLKSGEVPPAVPLPAAGLLLMSALTGLGAMSRYRRTKSSAL